MASLVMGSLGTRMPTCCARQSCNLSEMVTMDGFDTNRMLLRGLVVVCGSRSLGVAGVSVVVKISSAMAANSLSMTTRSGTLVVALGVALLSSTAPLVCPMLALVMSMEFTWTVMSCTWCGQFA